MPVNPLFKPEQVTHILKDCNVRILVTTPEQLAAPQHSPHRVIDGDIAAILYTSGSTGKPKGVVLSHRNLVAGAESVSQYLENRPEDRIPSVLPLSFDYGLSQLTMAFRVGACAVLVNYLFPRDVIRAVEREKIIGLAALRARSPRTRPCLMYGLTEALHSTYLPPDEVNCRPNSMGKAIPNAEIMVVWEDGTPCAPGEPCELVHRGVHVALGYWNDPEKMAERYKPAPGQPAELPISEMAVWSGNTVKMDDEGFMYFIGRRDEIIKASGYRVNNLLRNDTYRGGGSGVCNRVGRRSGCNRRAASGVGAGGGACDLCAE